MSTKDIILKVILILDTDNNLVKQWQYRTKTQALREYRGNKKHGYYDFETGTFRKDYRIELI